MSLFALSHSYHHSYNKLLPSTHFAIDENSLPFDLQSKISTEDKLDLENFLKGNVDVPWKGTRSILGRKKQIPSQDYDAQQVIRICLDALVINDDPQLDHGCCVLLSFMSPIGPLAESGLDPAGYGRFLRSTDYGVLLDHKKAEFVGPPEWLTPDQTKMKQKIRIESFNITNGKASQTIFSFYLSKIDFFWLVDVILLER
eukprot:gene8598-11618_t